MTHLFSLPSDSFQTTSDDCYTPRWVFDAMGLEFDLDVAAPPGGPPHVPCDRYYTAEDDGLEQPWDGLVWCNPPYSKFRPWADRWAEHDRGVLMGMTSARSMGRAVGLWNADAVAFIDVQFERPGLPLRDVPTAIFVAFRGIGTEAAERLAGADPRGAILYGRNPDRERREMARLIGRELGCVRKGSFDGHAMCGEHHYPWLSTGECPTQERVTDAVMAKLRQGGVA